MRKLLALVILSVAIPVNAESIRLKRDSSGMYRVNILVGTVPVQAMIDTGASMVSLSRRVINESGNGHSCRWLMTQTANGPREVCGVRLDSVTLPGFKLRDVEATSFPAEMGEQDGLIGNSILKHFKIEIQDGVMTLSR